MAPYPTTAYERRFLEAATAREFVALAEAVASDRDLPAADRDTLRACCLSVAAGQIDPAEALAEELNAMFARWAADEDVGCDAWGDIDEDERDSLFCHHYGVRDDFMRVVAGQRAYVRGLAA